MANPWDNDPVVKPASGGAEPWKSDPMVGASSVPAAPTSVASRALSNLPASIGSGIKNMFSFGGMNGDTQPAPSGTPPAAPDHNPITGLKNLVNRLGTREAWSLPSAPPVPAHPLTNIGENIKSSFASTPYAHPLESFAQDPLGTVQSFVAPLQGVGAARGIEPPSISKGASALTRVNPERAVNRVFRPTPADSEFPAVTPSAFSDVKRFGGDVPKTIFGNPKPGNENLMPGGVTDTAIGNMQSQGLEPWLARARNMGVQIPGDEIVAATRKAIPDLMRTRDPQGAARLEQQAQQSFGGKTFTPDQFRDWLKTQNGTLQSFYSRSGASQGAAEAGGTPSAIEKAQADAMRETLYRHLDPENNGAGPREIQQRTGNVIGLRNAADRKANSILGEKPITPIGAMAAPFNAGVRLFRGDPAGAIGALGHPFRGPSDALISNIYRQAPEAADLPQPPSFTPRGLIGPGPIRMGTPDTSGPVNSIIPPHFGSTSTRLLEAPKGPIGVSGVTAPDLSGMIRKGVKGFAAGPRQLPAPTSGIGVSGNLMPDEATALTRKMTGGPPLLPPPTPGQPPVNIIQGQPSLISPGEKANINTISPITAGGERGGRMLDIPRSMREKVK